MRKTIAQIATGIAVGLACVVAPMAWADMTPVQQHGALSVKGNRIVDASGQPTALSGISFFWSNTGWGQEGFYTPQAVGYFVRDWKASLVRVAVGVDGRGGYAEDAPSNRARAEAVIDAAIQNGVYVLIDWHSHRAERDPAAAVAFFTDMAKKYGDRPNVIYEVYNEPLNTVDWSKDVKPYAEKVIAAIRAIDPDNLIVVGSPTWSQDVDIAAKDPIKGYGNLSYTMHFYSGSHKEYLRQKTTAALKAGLSVFVSEWGTVNADGNGPVAAEEVARWVDYMRKNCLSNANWSVSNKAESASIFKPGTSPNGPWSDKDLTPSGLMVRDLVRHWSATCQ